MSNDKNTEALNAIGKLMGKLSTKTIPSWDISEKGQSIKNHIRRFENAIQPDLDEDEKARDLKRRVTKRVTKRCLLL